MKVRLSLAAATIFLGACSLLDPLDDVSEGAPEADRGGDAGTSSSSSSGSTGAAGASDAGGTPIDAAAGDAAPPFDTSACTRTETEPNSAASPMVIAPGTTICGEVGPGDDDAFIVTTTTASSFHIEITAEVAIDVAVQSQGAQSTGHATDTNPYSLNRNAASAGDTTTKITPVSGKRSRYVLQWL